MPNPPSDRWKRSKDTTHRDPLPPSSPKERNSAPGHHRPPGKRPTPGEPNPRPTNDHPRDRWTHQEQGSHAHKRSVPEPASIPSPAPDVRTATVNRTHQEHLRSPEPPSGTAARPLHTYLRDPRIFLGTAGAALLLVIFIIGGSIFALRGTDDDSGMTGGSSDGFALTDDEVRNVFSIDGIMHDCVLNDDFYNAAEVTDVEQMDSQGSCVGESEYSSQTFEIHLNQTPRTSSVSSISTITVGTTPWKRISSPPGENSGIPCAYFYNGNTSSLSLISDDSCTDLEPLARQFQNLFDRKTWIDLKDSGSSRPAPELLDPLEDAG